MTNLPRRLIAELIGSLFLAAIVVGSGIAAQRLSPENAGLELTENALATALGLYFLIAVFAPLSGAHFNPLVSVVDAVFGHRTWRDVAAYVPAQVLGCILGTALANLMFGGPAITLSNTARLTPAHFLSEVVATAGLLLVIFVLAKTGRSNFAAGAVAGYIGAAYLFTSSTSFANPAITIGRIFTDSFAGIAPLSALGFIGAQVIGAVIGTAIVWFITERRSIKP